MTIKEVGGLWAEAFQAGAEAGSRITQGTSSWCLRTGSLVGTGAWRQEDLVPSPVCGSEPATSLWIPTLHNQGV